MEVKKIISQHLLLPKRFIQMFGINPAVLLMELIDKELYHYKHDSVLSDGYFYHSKDHVFNNTALPRGKFDTARKKLEEQNLIFSKLGKGKKLHFKINNEALNQIFYPKNQEMWDMELSLEPFMDESFIRYPIALAHSIGINETILIKDLLSKRNYFLKKGELRNGYFFNSVKNVQEDTTLTKKQQLKCVKNLTVLELLSIQLDYDNTRYFCLNLEGIVKYESLDLNKLLNKGESKKGPKLESKKSIQLENPFENTVSQKRSHSKSEKGNVFESKKSPDVIDELALDRKLEKHSLEREIGHINKTKLIKSNNNIKQMKLLLCDLNFGKAYIENIFENYELLNISISTQKFSELLQAQEKGQYDFDPLNAMTEILEKNETLIERFYNIFIYDEKIIGETLINFSEIEVEQMFTSIQSGKRKSALAQVKDFLKKPFIKKTDEVSVEAQIGNLIDVQVQQWIQNNEEDYEVMLQQEQIEILEANPLEENPLDKSKNIIRNFIISKKLKL